MNLDKLLIGLFCFVVLVSYTDTGYTTTPTPASTSPEITEIHINVLNHPDPKGMIRHMVESLFQLKTGMPFSPEQLNQSISALKRSHRFESIHVESQEGHRRFELQVDVTPYPLIKKIHIKNNFPIFHYDILKALTITTGDSLRADQLPQQAEAVAALYRDQGFIAPIVEVNEKIDPKDGQATLLIQVDKGPYYRVGHIRFIGNDALDHSQLKTRMITWRRSLALGIFGRFVEGNLKKDIEILTQLYRKKKFTEATVSYKLNKIKKDRTANLEINIHEGPSYRILFSGNQNISTRTLKKDVAILKKGNVRNLNVRKAIKKIETRYQKAGFLEAKVTMKADRVSEKGIDIRRIRYNIVEGPQTLVQRVTLTGNQSIDTATLKSNILTRPPKWNHDGGFSRDKLKDDLQAIRFQYHEQGFRSPKVEVSEKLQPNREKIDIVIHVDEGVSTRVRQVHFDGLTAISRDEALKHIALKPGSPFRDYMLANDENVLKSLIAAKGHTKVNITGTYTLLEDQTQADITYHITEGPSLRLGDIFYQGNFKTQTKALDREWTLSKGAPLNPYRMLESENNIRNLDIIDTATSTPLEGYEKDDSVDVIVKLAERKPYVFEVSGGYESDRRFFMSGKLADHNLFGMNRMGWVSGEVSEIGYRYESGIREPRLFGSRIAANFHGFFERQEQFNQDFGIRKAGATLGFERSSTQRIATGIHVKYAYLDLFEKDSDETSNLSTSPQEQPRNVIVGTPRVQYDSRDSFIRPRQGIFSLADIDISKGIRNDLDNFLRYRIDVRYFWSPTDPITLAFIGRGGYLSPYGDADTIPKDQLFYLGGNTDVRGFKQHAMITDSNGDAVGGEKSLNGSVEARIGIGSSWEIPLFIDVGWIGGIQEPGIDPDVRITAGTGLRYITPLGPIGILYGYKLDRQPDEPAGAFHFSLGYTF